MNTSLAVGIGMLVAKWVAFVLTGSSVIFGDAAESVVHIIAVWFAWYALRVTIRPPDEDHPYGHDKIGFVSAGIEGGLICIAAVVIIVTSSGKLVNGVELADLDVGMLITAGAAGINGVLGWYLIRTGKSTSSLVIEANGRHVMTDVWTSVGALLGLGLAELTGLYWLDPIFAILFAANIIREGGKLVSMSVKGLMDTTDAVLVRKVKALLDDYCLHHSCTYHRLRLRNAGSVIHVDYHLQVPDDMRMQDAHALATELEDSVRDMLGSTAEVFTHLESVTQPEGHI